MQAPMQTNKQATSRSKAFRPSTETQGRFAFSSPLSSKPTKSRVVSSPSSPTHPSRPRTSLDCGASKSSSRGELMRREVTGTTARPAQTPRPHASPDRSRPKRPAPRRPKSANSSADRLAVQNRAPVQSARPDTTIAPSAAPIAGTPSRSHFDTAPRTANIRKDPLRVAAAIGGETVRIVLALALIAAALIL